jgi:pyridoxamine 5'-phosphate oxidase-like protein
MAITWADRADEAIAGDLTAAVAYVTPAGGAVVTAVSPIGLRDRDAGTVTFTTSLGFGKKLERIARNPRVALAYHAREHGFAESSDYVLVQGDAQASTEPSREYLENTLRPAASRFMGPPKEGRLFWDRWLREYYQDRVPVAVDVRRVTTWSTLDCTGAAEVQGEPAPGEPPAQAEPRNGTGPRVDVERAARKLRGLDHLLLSYVGADGYPEIVPVTIEDAGAQGIRLSSKRSLPPGGRRAGLLGHSYRAKLIGLAARQHTGWLTVGAEGALYAPHTESGFRAPANKTLLLISNGLLAKIGLRRARKQQAAAAAP